MYFEKSIHRTPIGTVGVLCKQVSAFWTNIPPDIQRIEGEIPVKFGGDAVEVPGARDLLGKLETANAPWAIVTSGTRLLVQGWLKILGLSEPRILVTAEDVANGKPDPGCYLNGAAKLGLNASDVLVLEDAPAGIRAGKAAGCRVVALATTHRIVDLKEAGADWIVEDLRSVVIRGFNQGSSKIVIEIRQALRNA
jgi:glycerol-1-phosphatase